MANYSKEPQSAGRKGYRKWEDVRAEANVDKEAVANARAESIAAIAKNTERERISAGLLQYAKQLRIVGASEAAKAVEDAEALFVTGGEPQ